MEDKNIYDVIIIGGGASGLFCASAYGRRVNGLILEKTNFAGKKLLMSGSGQCNITHSGDIKEFIGHYGEKGKKIRSALYKFSNKAVIEFFQEKGVLMMSREDGKVFPEALNAQVVLETLTEGARENGFGIRYEHSVRRIEPLNGKYVIICDGAHGKKKSEFQTHKIVVAAGGCSYPSTGSDGSMLQVLRELGLEIIPPRPSLTPIFVQNYPYEELSGISLSPALITVNGKRVCDDLLLTHRNFSGPGAINISRYVKTGDVLMINYFPGKTFEEIFSDFKQKVTKNSKQTITFLLEYLGTAIPKRFMEKLCERAGIDPGQKASGLNGSQLRTLAELLTKDTFSVSGTGGFSAAMATAGGVSLDEINLKNMECKKYPGLFIIGETLDVDGDTGGYNLQFAWSSGYLAGNTID